MTVDVEDFYDGMAALGHTRGAPAAAPNGLVSLLDHLEAQPTKPKVTLFVVGNYAPVGPRRPGRLRGGRPRDRQSRARPRPAAGAAGWWSGCAGAARCSRTSSVSLCTGFARPRFDVPGEGGLGALSRRAGRGAATATSRTPRGSGPAPRCARCRCCRGGGLRLGGGSYQRLLPFAAVAAADPARRHPAVLYYHSYDFDGTLAGAGRGALAHARPPAPRPRPHRARSPGVCTERFGSETCDHVTR